MHHGADELRGSTLGRGRLLLIELATKCVRGCMGRRGLRVVILFVATFTEVEIEALIASVTDALHLAFLQTTVTFEAREVLSRWFEPDFELMCLGVVVTQMQLLQRPGKVAILTKIDLVTLATMKTDADYRFQVTEGTSYILTVYRQSFRRVEIVFTGVTVVLRTLR